MNAQFYWIKKYNYFAQKLFIASFKSSLHPKPDIKSWKSCAIYYQNNVDGYQGLIIRRTNN